MSEIIATLSEIIQIVADNPASILIAFGFFSTILGWAVQESWLILLGGLMMTIGIIAHFAWLSKR